MDPSSLSILWMLHISKIIILDLWSCLSCVFPSLYLEDCCRAVRTVSTLMSPSYCSQTKTRPPRGRRVWRRESSTQSTMRGNGLYLSWSWVVYHGHCKSWLWLCRISPWSILFVCNFQFVMLVCSMQKRFVWILNVATLYGVRSLWLLRNHFYHILLCVKPFPAPSFPFPVSKNVTNKTEQPLLPGCDSLPRMLYRM